MRARLIAVLLRACLPGRSRRSETARARIWLPSTTAADKSTGRRPCRSGSITGAPKLRAMEIIDACETAPRGLSMGAIGYFSFDGALDLSVAIRTMTVRARRARFNVGGGIVTESDPAAEYEESLLKARALLRALGAKIVAS